MNEMQPERTPEGEIKDQTPIEGKTPETPPKVEGKVEGEVKAKEGAPSLLNEKPEAVPGAPEKYADFKVPEGYTLDGEVAKEAGAIFKDLGLNQEAAQRLVDFYVGKSQETHNAPFKLWQETQEKWINEVKNDPELGSKLPAIKATVAKAVDGLGDPKLAASFREAMDYTGAGSNPAFIRVFYKLAQMVTEGQHVAGGGPSKLGQSRPGEAPASAAKAMYPNLP